MNATLPVWLIIGVLVCRTLSAFGSGNDRQLDGVRKGGYRLAKFDADFWTPSNASGQLQTPTSALEVYSPQSRDLNEETIDPLPQNSNSVTKEISSNESLGRKLEDSDEEVEFEARHIKKKFKKKFGHKKKKKKKYTNKIKIRKTYKKMMMPLLIAYKLKFFTLIPVLIAGILLLAKTAGLAGFFFALFSTVMALKGRLG